LEKVLSARSGKFLYLEDHRSALESQVVVHNVIDIRVAATRRSASPSSRGDSKFGLQEESFKDES